MSNAQVAQSAQQLLDPAGTNPMTTAINQQAAWAIPASQQGAYANVGSGQQILTDFASQNAQANAAAQAASGGGTANASNAAAYQDQINQYNQLLGQADTNLQHGQSAIDTGYNNSLAQATGNNQNVLKNYDTQRTNTTQDYGHTLDTINQNARNGYNSLQALLGGTGSAADVLAPYAVSQQANQQRSGSSDAYAKNLASIDTGTQAAQQAFANQKKTLDGQHQDHTQKLLDSIAQQKIGYQQAIGAAQNQLNIAKGGKYQTPVAQNNAIAQLLAQQQQTPAAPQFSVQDYTAPQTNLAQYQAQAAQIGSGSNTPVAPGTDPAAALASLYKQDQKNTSAYSY